MKNKVLLLVINVENKPGDVYAQIWGENEKFN
jgi:hypothetical protein